MVIIRRIHLLMNLNLYALKFTLESLANSNDIVLQEQAEWSIKAIKSRECTSFS